MYNQNQQLPADPQSVNRAVFMYNLPNNPSIVPAIQLSPNMTQFLRTITGYSALELQEGVNKNNIRICMFNFLSANHWNNQPFFEFVIGVSELAEFLCATTGMPVDQCIALSSKKMASFTMATMVMQYPALQQFLQPNQMGELQQLIQEYQGLVNQIQQFKYNAANSGMMNNQFNTAPAGFNGGYNNNRQPIETFRNNQPLQYQQPQPLQRSVASSGGMFVNSPAPGPGISNVPDMPAYSGRRNRRQYEQLADDIDEVTFENQEVTIQRRAMPTFNPTDFDGLVLASKSGLSRTYSPNQPYHILYDPKRFLLFHEADRNGNVKETLKKRSEVGMEYKDHELDPMLRMKARDEELYGSKRVIPNWEFLKTVKAIEQFTAEAPVDEVTKDRKPLIIDQPVSFCDNILAHSFEEAMMIAKLKLSKEQIVIDDTTVFEFGYRLVTPFTFDASESGNLALLKEGLLTVETFIDAVDLMNKLNDLIPSRLWHYINDRLTKAVNDVLLFGMGIEKPYIEDFTADVIPLIKLLEKKWGDGVRNTFLKNEREFVRTALRNLKGVLAKEYTTRIMSGDDNNDYESTSIIFYEDHWVCVVPWFSSDIDVKMNGKVGSVLQSYTPEFYDSIKGIIERSRKAKMFKRHLYTADNECINIHETIYSTEFFVISI